MVASGRFIRLDAEPEGRFGEAIESNRFAAFFNDVLRCGRVQEYGVAPEFVSVPGPIGPAGVQDRNNAVIDLHAGFDDLICANAFPPLQMGQGDNPAFADGMLQGDFLDRPAAGFQEVTRRIDMGAYMSENLQPG